MVDDSLLLGWSKKGFAKDTDYAALSPSSAKLFAEDPHLYFLKKVRKLKEPMSMPLVVGISVHAGMETFLHHHYVREGFGFEAAAKKGLRMAADEMAQHWERLESPHVRVNADEPWNPRDKTEVFVTLPEMEERVVGLLWEAFCSIDQWAGEFTIFEAQTWANRVEASVGELAIEHDRPSHTITSYDPHTENYGEMTAALIGGVPVRGRIDLLCRWPDGREMIIDHKAVTKVVSYYPPYSGSGPWTRYAPSYNVADSYQLDVYSYASGIPRSGFQFLLRRPQYMPSQRPLYGARQRGPYLLWLSVNSWNTTQTRAFSPTFAAIMLHCFPSSWRSIARPSGVKPPISGRSKSICSLTSGRKSMATHW